MKVSTLVFDLDGTISDPSRGIINCVNYALEKCGFEPQSPEAISGEIGPPLDLMFNKFIPGISDNQMESMVAAYRERFVSEGFAENILYQGMQQTIASLHQSGFRLGVCTSKPERPARQVLEHFGLLHYFQFVSGGDIGIAKGSQLAELLANKVIDKNAVMIGDRGVDLIAGTSNQLRTVGVLWGFGNLEELSAQNPELVLQNVPELLTSFTSEASG